MTHPAQFSPSIITSLATLIVVHDIRKVFDPFAGPGNRLAKLCDDGGLPFAGCDIEDWTGRDERVLVADATLLPPEIYRGRWVITSPCVAPQERVLTADLRWVPSGDLKVGDKLMAFDEFGPGQQANGSAARRRWRIATVLESHGAKKSCVRVILANGDSVVCTADHPWLIDPHEYGSQAVWRRADSLMDMQRKTSHPPYALQQLEPWSERRTYLHGWLAGMFDGEGSLAFGHDGSPKLIICQAEGETREAIERRLGEAGYEFSILSRGPAENGRREMFNFYISGGFPGILRCMGETRPERLISKLSGLDVASRVIQPWRVQIEAVEKLGTREIQALTTSTGTYICEGYLHHNTYGNGINDHFQPKDDSKRYTYRIALGQPLHENNSGRYGIRAGRTAWNKYWLINERAVARWHLAEGAIVNVKDFIANGEEVNLGAEWSLLLQGLGFETEMIKVSTPGMRNGDNRELRADGEWLIVATR